MKCTECNKEVKPVVAIDIDGTMGMYHKHFLEYAADYLNKRYQMHYVGNQPFKEWFCTTYKVSFDTWHDIKLAYRQGGMKRTMPMYKDADTLCYEIKNAGAELWVTTTRPYIRHDNIDPDTRHWLDRHHIPYDYLIYDGHKYRNLKHLVGPGRVCAVLDDLGEELLEAQKLFGDNVPILRMNEYNKAFQYNPRAMSLPMAGRLIQDRIKEWRKRNEGTDAVRCDDQQDPAGVSEEVSGEVV